jgi:hypothetical protein
MPAASPREECLVTHDDQVAPSLRRSIFELGTLALLLAGWMAVLYWLTGPPDPARLPVWPGWDAFAAMASSRTAPLNGALQLTILVLWAMAIALAVWLVVSVVLEAVLLLIERGPARGSAWLGTVRAVLRRASFPLVHRTVVTLLAVQLVMRAPDPIFAQVAGPTTEQTVAPAAAQLSDDDADQTSAPPAAMWHTVQHGDTLWGLSRHYYGSGAEFDRIVEANVGRPLSRGRTFSRAGIIQPGDVLEIPLPSMVIEEHDGARFYVVQPGDTLIGITARLGHADWHEIFRLNVGVARLGERGPVLTDPNIIWPGLRLLLPSDSTTSEPAPDEPPTEVTPAPAAAVAPMPAVEPDRQDQSAPAVTPVASVSPTAAATSALTSAPAPVETVLPTQVAPPTMQPVEQVRPESGQPQLPPAAAALGAAGLAAAALAARRLVVYKRKPGRDPDGPESDVQIEDGFAEVDPVENLARRLAHTSDPASAIASLWGQAYAAIFDEQLRPQQRSEVQGVTVAATRHGRSSTTLVIAAPVPARPYFVHHMRAAAERAFGSQVDVDGLVGQDGDVLIRVTWDPRRPIAGHLLELVGDGAAHSAWPAPCLVPAMVLYDRQHLAVNWHTLGNVLVAAPTGQGADIPLTALVAALASVRAPEDLGLMVIARPRTLPQEIGVFPHGLLDVVDPGDPDAIHLALESVKLEIDRRRQTSSSGEADLVVVVRELGDLEPDSMTMAAAIAVTGPEHGVRLLIASERPVAGLLEACPFFDKLGTRLVLQTATEEDSVALLGMDGAEGLGAGGHALLRLEGRTPHRGWAHRVSADHLARLVHMMGTRAPTTTTPEPELQPSVADEHTPSNTPETADDDDADEDASASRASDTSAAQTDTPGPPGISNTSSLLQRLRSAPVRVRCFGARSVWYGDRLAEIADPQLLLLLAVHPVTGIQSEAVVDMLWSTPPVNAPRALRKKRHELRVQLRQLAPELASLDPVPGNQIHGEKEVVLDISIVASDVHEFTELLRCAEKLEPADAIEAYEAALALYRGDLLDSSDMPNYRWMYNEDPQVGVLLRSDFRRLHKEARRRLAELLAAGPEEGLARAEELYSGLCAEDLDDERLWIALFRIYERTGSSLGLEGAVQRFRHALIEMGATSITDVDRVPLPPNLDRIVKDIWARISNGESPIA